jgi:hypothetical protein
VAFPRLNSAAFWFLPGGLLMLAQMVCLDRRFQRMNCFNMRELQSLFKERFFNDLITTNSYHMLTHRVILNLRFKDFFSHSHDGAIFAYAQFPVKYAYERALFVDNLPNKQIYSSDTIVYTSYGTHLLT